METRKTFQILLLEDELTLSKELKVFLQSKQIECDQVYDGATFFRQLRVKSYDLFLLDINVPNVNGLDVCQTIRSTDNQTPIIMLTAYGELQDKADAFKRGADDYLVKPFHFEELYLRIQSLFRRTAQLPQEVELFQIGDLEINNYDFTVKRQGKNIDLTPKEFQLLLILARGNGRTLSKLHIAENLWDSHIETNLNTIEVYINFLRRKIDKGFEEKLIHTRTGFGYSLKVMK
jgi:DNA-binding response OmpR family regulator